MRKISSLHSAVSIEHRLVTDGRTDNGPWHTALHVATRGKNSFNGGPVTTHQHTFRVLLVASTWTFLYRGLTNLRLKQSGRSSPASTSKQAICPLVSRAHMWNRSFTAPTGPSVQTSATPRDPFPPDISSHHHKHQSDTADVARRS